MIQVSFMDPYNRIYDLVDGDEFMLSVIVGPAIILVYFWLTNLPFILIDLLQPKWAQAYKIQEDKPASWEQYKKAIKCALLNSSIYTSLAMYIFTYLGGKLTGVSYGKWLPSWTSLFIHQFFYAMMNEVAFYYLHRLFHHRLLYKHIHKIHHKWTAPISLSCLYAHPSEYIISNLLPILIGPVLFGAHITSVWLWTCMALTYTTLSHCGYHFPFIKPGEFHDYHHSRFKENFGMCGLMDWLHGTSAKYATTIHFKRDRYTASLVPIKEQYPEERFAI